MSKSQMTISGRIVWTLAPSNNPMERVTGKDRTTGQVYLDKAGQPRQQTTFSLAVPKNSEQLKQLEELKKIEIYKIYPSGQVPKNFAFKMIDADVEVDDKGRPYSQREGHTGHIIIAFNAYFPVNWYQFDGVNYNEINTGIKTGDFVDVNFTLTAHGPSPKGGAAGFYVEPKAVLFRSIGDAIDKKVQTADPAKAFGQPMQQAAPMTQPQFTQQAQQPATQWAPQQQAAPAQFQQPAQPQQPVQQTQQAQPYYGGLPPQFQK